MKKIGFMISGGISFVCFLLLGLVCRHMSHSLEEQQMAARWSEKKDVAQISCFFSPDAQVSVDSIEEFEHSLDNALKEASITQDSMNPGARLWADAYSADGKITLSSDRTSVEADAIGIGGDFFLFHPVRLLEGAYFSGNDLNQDYCVIDEDMAWQLFGSNDVDGMMVYIGGTPHIVTGVVSRPEGRLEQAAGLDATVVYVSYQTLEELGRSNGINHYEIVMPNPVSSFALNLVKERMSYAEKEVEWVENTSRFSLFNELKVLAAFGTRSMNGKAIIYPYWENIARGYEDIIALFVLFMLLLVLYPLILCIVCFILWWKHKGWTIKGVWLKVKDKTERYFEKRRENRKHKKEDGDFFEEEMYL
ncbi:MAG: ABC transporter permease [Lachnospiraceae bacterium]|nr:ABC transporter permease [Lachnospiraceae bacterium]